jgi:hypothetical protein
MTMPVASTMAVSATACTRWTPGVLTVARTTGSVRRLSCRYLLTTRQTIETANARKPDVSVRSPAMTGQYG